MDDVHRRQVRDDRDVDRQIHLVDRVNVIGAIRVAPVETDCVARGDQTGVSTAEATVGARIHRMPFKLLRDDVDDRRAVLGWNRVDTHRPGRDGEPEQDDRLDDDDRHVEIVRRGVALDAHVVGLRVR